MANLKPYYDAALAADAEVKRVMTEIETHFSAALAADAEAQRIMKEMDAALKLGTEEGKTKALGMKPTLDAANAKAEEARGKALELRPVLDEAKAKGEEANRLYASMRDASLVNDSAAALFTAPVDQAANGQQGADPKVMNRAAFEALDPVTRMKFVQDGGRVEE